MDRRGMEPSVYFKTWSVASQMLDGNWMLNHCRWFKRPWIKAESLPEYQVPPPSLVEPLGSTAVSNLKEVSPREIDIIESNNEINETAENDEFFGPDEDNGERNLFNFIDNMLAK